MLLDEVVGVDGELVPLGEHLGPVPGLVLEAVERRRAQLVAAGLAVFGTAGFRGATVRGICREAGLTDRYFYESFDTKEDLLLAVYAECIERLQLGLMPVLQHWASTGDPGPGLEQGLDTYFRWVEDPHVGKVVWQEILGVSERVDAVYVATIHGFAMTLLGVAREAGVEWADDPAAPMIAVGGVGALVQAAMQWRFEGFTTPRETMVAAARRLLLGVAVPLTAPALTRCPVGRKPCGIPARLLMTDCQSPGPRCRPTASPSSPPWPPRASSPTATAQRRWPAS